MAVAAFGTLACAHCGGDPVAPAPDLESEPAKEPPPTPAAVPTPLVDAPAAAVDTPAPPAPSVVAAGPYEESIAGLQLGMTVEQMQAVLPGMVPRGEERPFTPNTHVIGPETYYTREYGDPSGRVAVVTASKQPGGEKRAQSISTRDDVHPGTSRGVRVGDDARAFEKAYPARDRIQPIPGEFWVRFSDDEMLTVLIDEGHVVALHLGVATDPADIEE